MLCFTEPVCAVHGPDPGPHPPGDRPRRDGGEDVHPGGVLTWPLQVQCHSHHAELSNSVVIKVQSKIKPNMTTCNM